MVEPFKPKNYNKKPPVQICRTHDESLGMIFCDWREITWPLEAKANRWDSAVQVLSAMSGATAQVLWWFDPGLFENRVMNGNEPLISTGLSWVYHVLSRFITKKPYSYAKHYSQTHPNKEKMKMTFPTGHEPLLQVATYHLRTRPEALLLLLRLLQHPCGRWELQDPKMEVLYHLLYHVFSKITWGVCIPWNLALA